MLFTDVPTTYHFSPNGQHRKGILAIFHVNQVKKDINDIFHVLHGREDILCLRKKSRQDFFSQKGCDK